MFDNPLFYGLLLAAAGAAFAVGIVLQKRRAEADRSRREKELQDRLAAVRGEGERLHREMEVKLKDEILRRREGLEKEMAESRQELKSQEKRVLKREDEFDRKMDVIAKKEKYLERAEMGISDKQKELQGKEALLIQKLEEEKQVLLKVAGISKEDATQMIMKHLEGELESETAAMITKYQEIAKDTSEKKAKHILATAIQRYAADIATESVVSSLQLPNDDMKGRIIGREGRNIRAFELATGVDVIVDDTPGMVVISSFDGIRREIARRALEKLVLDGRIHPARIEEVVEATRKEVEQAIQEAGEQAVYELNVTGVHPKIVSTLGRLRFRTSYSQNILKHSIEVGFIAGNIAGELGLDANLARRCGLLHDIGKALDHEMEGGHPLIGADLAKRHGEKDIVVNAIAAHHEEVEPKSLYPIIVQAADALSGARPGARRESYEKYVKRMESLEAIATQQQGVVNAYAIQAGRELRIIVAADKVSDDQMKKLARDTANQVERDLQFPGQIKVTVIRETRAVEYAK
ncbi:MAG: ribonuclease Y [Planctomycetota bacterium]